MSPDEIKKWLRSYSALKSEREGVLRQISEIEADRASIRSPRLTGMPHGSGLSDPTAEVVARYEAVLAERREKSNQLLDKTDTIERALELLDSLEADLLRRHYLLGDEWHIVAAAVNRSESGCYEIARRAILTLSKSL